MASGSSVVDQYAPLIEYVLEACKLGDLAPVRDSKEMLRVVIQRLKHAKRECPGTLAGAFDELEKPAMALVDYLIGCSELPFAESWRDKRPGAAAVECSSADETFAKALDEALDQSRGDLLPFYYLALQLGYGGTLSVSDMEDRRMKIEAQIFDSRRRDRDGKYDPPFRRDNDGIFLRTYTEKRDFTIPPEESVILVLVVTVVLGLSGIVFTVAKYVDATDGLRNLLESVAK